MYKNDINLTTTVRIDTSVRTTKAGCGECGGSGCGNRGGGLTGDGKLLCGSRFRLG